MSPNTMLPALAHPWVKADGKILPVRPEPALSAAAIESIRTSFPGTLTAEHEELLRHSRGIHDTPLGYLDFTGQWHDEEALSVFRPCLTVAMDAQGRRWIAETGNAQGLPGPVWCVLQAPQVVVYVSQDLGTFLSQLHAHVCDHSVAGWLRAIDAAAVRSWKQRGALAFQARVQCGHDRDVRGWLLQLPRDSRVYDLRSPRFGAGWPYGAAGADGRFYRCGKELLFAVAGFPAPTRWAEYLENLAQHHRSLLPAIVTSARAHGTNRTVLPPNSNYLHMKSCA